MLGANPKNMDHTMYVYDNPEPAIPRNKQPLATHTIASNDTHGSGIFPDAQIGLASYVVGYATGPDPRQIVSLSYIPPVGGEITSIEAELSDLEVTIGYVRVSYSVAPGALPHDDGDWIGIYEGANFVDLYWSAPKWTARVPTNDSSGKAYINGTHIVRAKSYMLAYFKSDWCRGDLAAAISFRVGG
jgi:hypothetical protein